MRLFAILLLVLIAGLGFALWQGIDLGTGRLAATGEAEDLGVQEVELTAAEPGSEAPLASRCGTAAGSTTGSVSVPS